ncbi:hypothetical protein [Scytonema sp. NUACC26]|uniref:hypothetical protein n=1 Tax=Scytonema sp. NUACC26 TaxID=3140176 RepID=UPI0034DBB185
MQRIFGTACALLALTIPTLMISRQAVADELKENGCQSVVGTYLATANSANSISDPATTYSELIAFNKDGNLIATDSNAGGDPDTTSVNNQPFGSAHGSWKCIGKEIVAKVFNFNYQTREGLASSISITTYKLIFHPKTQTITGTASYDNYDINSTPQNPVLLPNTGGPFVSNYSGSRITPE